VKVVIPNSSVNTPLAINSYAYRASNLFIKINPYRDLIDEFLRSREAARPLVVDPWQAVIDLDKRSADGIKALQKKYQNSVFGFDRDAAFYAFYKSLTPEITRTYYLDFRWCGKFRRNGGTGPGVPHQRLRYEPAPPIARVEAGAVCRPYASKRLNEDIAADRRAAVAIRAKGIERSSPAIINAEPFESMAAAEEVVARYLRDFNTADGALLLSHFNRFLRKHAPKLYRGSDIEWEDRLQCVREGFLKSLPRFDPAKGRLNAWALLYLRDTMRAAAKSANPAYGLTRGKNESKKSFRRRFMETRTLFNTASLDLPQYREDPESESWHSYFEDDDVDEHSGEREAIIRAAVAALDPRSRRIIESRHLDSERKTLDELGDELGVTAERTRQIETVALKKFTASVKTPNVADPNRTRLVEAAFRNQSKTIELINLNRTYGVRWRGGNYQTLSYLFEREYYEARRTGKRSAIEEDLETECIDLLRNNVPPASIMRRALGRLIDRGFSDELVNAARPYLRAAIRRTQSRVEPKRKPRTRIRSWRTPKISEIREGAPL
jgi:RNA polymerase sigma-32 factor